jgi:hypothetical protein
MIARDPAIPLNPFLSAILLSANPQIRKPDIPLIGWASVGVLGVLG